MITAVDAVARSLLPAWRGISKAFQLKVSGRAAANRGRRAQRRLSRPRKERGLCPRFRPSMRRSGWSRRPRRRVLLREEEPLRFSARPRPAHRSPPRQRPPPLQLWSPRGARPTARSAGTGGAPCGAGRAPAIRRGTLLPPLPGCPCGSSVLRSAACIGACNQPSLLQPSVLFPFLGRSRAVLP